MLHDYNELYLRSVNYIYQASDKNHKEVTYQFMG